MYNWLIERFSERARSLTIPQGMPGSFTNVSVKTSRSGDAGYILFEPNDSLAGKITDMPVRVRIAYNSNYAKIGMGDRYTLQMLAAEFWTLTHNVWNLFPLPSSERDPDGTIVHDTTDDGQKFYHSLPINEMDIPPVRIQEDNARATSINLAIDQAHMLQFWAWSGQAVRTGIHLNINSYSCEYWSDIVMQLTDEENEGLAYCEILHQHWLAVLGQVSPQVAIACSQLGIDFSYKMKYQNNVLKVWYNPNDFIRTGVTTPLAEKPVPKDTWTNGAITVLSCPPMSHDVAVDFGRILLGGDMQDRFDNQEVQGGRIALIEDGADVCNSESDSEDEEDGEVLTGHTLLMFRSI
jgi:hypothetical protein